MSDPIFFIEHFTLLSEFTSRRIELEEIDRDILQCFVEYPGIWAYRIYKNPEKFLGRYVFDRKVRRCVSRLSDKGLIDGDEKEKVFCLTRQKGKKLSTGGIFYLFLNIRMMLDRIFKTILNNYGENILFQIFLYPYLDKNTLLAIQDSNLLSRIYLHLNQCCIEIDNISYISGKNTYTTQEIFIWRDVPASKIETRRLLNFLEQRYRLSWLEHAAIAKSGDNNSLWIRYNANYVSIKLDKDKKTGTMKIRDKRKENEYQVIVKAFSADFLSVRVPIMSTKENAAHYLLLSTQQHVPGFLFDLASKVVPGSSDFEILSCDEKFRQALEKTKMKFDDKYKTLQINAS